MTAMKKTVNSVKKAPAPSVDSVGKAILRKYRKAFTVLASY